VLPDLQVETIRSLPTAPTASALRCGAGPRPTRSAGAGLLDLALLPPAVIERGIEQLRDDLEAGEWDRRYGELRERESLDIGVRLVSAQL
jgi:hypothetical protein